MRSGACLTRAPTATRERGCGGCSRRAAAVKRYGCWVGGTVGAELPVAPSCGLGSFVNNGSLLLEKQRPSAVGGLGFAVWALGLLWWGQYRCRVCLPMLRGWP